MQSTHQLRDRVEEAASQRGQGTELVSLYVPAGKDLRSIRSRVDTEYAEAENIKSDRTREHVQDALDRLGRILATYGETPDNGLAAFVGHIDGGLREYVFDDLPRPVESSMYRCSNEFETDDLLALVAPTNRYGLLVIERNQAAIGELSGRRVTELATLEGAVMGKSRAGGQSAKRFERVREKQKHQFFQKVAAAAEGALLDSGDAPDGLLIGGTTIAVEEFISGSYLHHALRDARMGGTYAIEYATEQGLQQLAKKGQDAVEAADMAAERDAMDRFFRELKAGELAAYGEGSIETALQYGAVDTLLVSAALPREDVREWEQRAGSIGAETLVVSESFEKGAQLRDAFGGVAALLRYEIE